MFTLPTLPCSPKKKLCLARCALTACWDGQIWSIWIFFLKLRFIDYIESLQSVCRQHCKKLEGLSHTKFSLLTSACLGSDELQNRRSLGINYSEGRECRCQLHYVLHNCGGRCFPLFLQSEANSWELVSTMMCSSYLPGLYEHHHVAPLPQPTKSSQPDWSNEPRLRVACHHYHTSPLPLHPYHHHAQKDLICINLQGPFLQWHPFHHSIRTGLVLRWASRN